MESNITGGPTSLILEMTNASISLYTVMQCVIYIKIKSYAIQFIFVMKYILFVIIVNGNIICNMFHNVTLCNHTNIRALARLVESSLQSLHKFSGHQKELTAIKVMKENLLMCFNIFRRLKLQRTFSEIYF